MPVRVEVGPRDLADGDGHAGAPRHRQRRTPAPLRRASAARSPTLLDADPADAARRGHRVPRRRTPSTSRRLDEAVEAAADRLRPHPVGSGRRGGRGPAGPGRRHRPLPAARRRPRARGRGRARPGRRRGPRLLRRLAQSRWTRCTPPSGDHDSITRRFSSSTRTVVDPLDVDAEQVPGLRRLLVELLEAAPRRPGRCVARSVTSTARPVSLASPAAAGSCCPSAAWRDSHGTQCSAMRGSRRTVVGLASVGHRSQPQRALEEHRVDAADPW